MRKPPEVVQLRWLWNLQIFAQDVMYLAAKSGTHVFLCHSRLTAYPTLSSENGAKAGLYGLQMPLDKMESSVSKYQMSYFPSCTVFLIAYDNYLSFTSACCLLNLPLLFLEKRKQLQNLINYLMFPVSVAGPHWIRAYCSCSYLAIKELYLREEFNQNFFLPTVPSGGFNTQGVAPAYGGQFLYLSWWMGL